MYFWHHFFTFFCHPCYTYPLTCHCPFNLPYTYQRLSFFSPPLIFLEAFFPVVARTLLLFPATSWSLLYVPSTSSQQPPILCCKTSQDLLCYPLFLIHCKSNGVFPFHSRHLVIDSNPRLSTVWQEDSTSHCDRLFAISRCPSSSSLVVTLCV